MSFEVCQLISPEDCHEALSQWRKDCTFDVIPVIREMKKALYTQNEIRDSLSNLENDSDIALDGLLQLVENNRGTILYHFLLALQKDPDDDQSLLKRLNIAMHTYPCKSSELDCQVPCQKSSPCQREDLRNEHHFNGHDARVPTELVCRIHNATLASWCSDCNLYLCFKYTTKKCNPSSHEVVLIEEIANDVRNWIKTCLKHLPKVDVTDDVALCLPSQCNEHSFTRKYMDVLTENKQRLCSASDSALEEAKDIIEKEYQELTKEAMSVMMQVKQARDYANSIIKDDFLLFHQREVLIRQLRLLRLRTGTADSCNSIPGTDHLHISSSDHPEAMKGNPKRLHIECLPEHYFSVTQELVGKIKFTEDSPSHFFWDPNFRVKKETEKPKYEVLESELKNSSEELQEAKKSLETLHNIIDEQKKRIEELQTKISNEASKAHSDCYLMGKLQRTYYYFRKKLTRADVDNILAELYSRARILDEDKQNVKKEDTDCRRAGELLDLILKKGVTSVRIFLKHIAANEELTRVFETGIVPCDND